jgi:adenine-specific DNA-methyltransferase
MIYIDPPYNTGNDFIYPDNYAENLSTYLEYTGQVDSEGKKFSTNTETDGRFHSKWMNMMYPRLFLAKNLLKQDGVIFISIDDKEMDNLKKLCDEIFGEENFVSNITWEGALKNDSRLISNSHDFVLVYCKDKSLFSEKNLFWRTKKEGIDKIYNTVNKLRKEYGENYEAINSELKTWFSSLKKDDPSYQHRHYNRVDRKGLYFPSDISWPGGGGPTYTVVHPKTGKPVKVPSRGWVFSTKERMQEIIDDNRVDFGKDENSVPTLKRYLEEIEGQVLPSVFYKDRRASMQRLRNLLGADVFDNPKDEDVLLKFIEATTDSSSIILDFFAGSGTTAHAVLNLNIEDGGGRKFILVQLPELCDEKSNAYNEGYRTIADISKERIRRVAKVIKKDYPIFNGDLGFKVFKLQPSNFKIWNAAIEKKPEIVQAEMDLHVSHLTREAQQENILYEILLKAGFELTTPIEKLEIESNTVFSVASGELLICLEKNLTHGLIKAIAEKQPTRVICLDEGFQNNDQLKTNAVQIMKSKNVVSFRTV